MAHWTSSGFQQYATGRIHACFLPMHNERGKSMLFFAGNGGIGWEVLASNFYSQFSALAENGIAVASGGTLTSWGNDTVTDEYQDLADYLTSRYGHQTTTVDVYGGSMGGCCALNFARRFPSMVEKIGLVIPMLDLEQFYDDNAGFRTEIDAAYVNHAGFLAALPTHNPMEFAASIDHETHIWYSTTDTLCPPANMTAFEALAPNCTKTSIGAVGHNGDNTVLSGADIAAWFA